MGGHLLHPVEALARVGEAVPHLLAQQVPLCQIPQLEHVMADLPPATVFSFAVRGTILQQDSHVDDIQCWGMLLQASSSICMMSALGTRSAEGAQEEAAGIRHGEVGRGDVIDGEATARTGQDFTIVVAHFTGTRFSQNQESDDLSLIHLEHSYSTRACMTNSHI